MRRGHDDFLTVLALVCFGLSVASGQNPTATPLVVPYVVGPSGGVGSAGSFQSPPSPAVPQTPSFTQDVLNGPGWPPQRPLAEDRAVPLTSQWSDGLKFRSDDNSFHFHLGGEGQIDSTWLIAPHSAFDLPNNGGTSGIGGSSAVFLRRVRLRAEGDIYDQIDYIVEYDFANAANENNGLEPPSFGNIAGQPTPTNVWMQIRDVPLLGKVRFGNLIVPVGFAKNISNRYQSFMERPDNDDAFYSTFNGGRNLGVIALNHTDNERLTWQYGVYRPSANVFGVALNKYSWGSRVTGLPLFEDQGQSLVHLGFGTLNGEIPQNELKVRARPLLRNGPGYANPILVNTGTVDGTYQYTVVPEFAAVFGPWSFQAEWAGQFLNNAKPKDKPVQGTAFFQGAYAEALYFLTGETQPYDKAEGTFGRVIPNQNLRLKRGEGCTGSGAWQVGARISYLDLNDGEIKGGRVYNATLGLNWYLNPNAKIQLNALVERRDQPGVTPAWISGIGIRAAYDF